jgi:hypothetical protein
MFSIPLIGYLRVDPLPDMMDPVVRKKYGLKEVVARAAHNEQDQGAIEMTDS